MKRQRFLITYFTRIWWRWRTKRFDNIWSFD